MLEEKTVLKSVEVLEQSSSINVLWENQILRDGIVISSSNYRCSYCSPITVTQLLLYFSIH